MFDTIIIGGGTAGLSAALVLGRSRRNVLVFDGGPPRNAPSPAVHSFFTRDGILPGELLRIGREQLAIHPNVEVRSGVVADIQKQQGYFDVFVDQTSYKARRILFATGVQDNLPSIPGLESLWGNRVFHCPYCHGWEVRDQPLAVIGNGFVGVEMSALLRQWSADVVLCTNGPAQFTHEEQERLSRIGMPVREEPISRFEEAPGGLVSLTFSTGEPLQRAVFLRPQQQQRSNLPQKLGCEISKENKVAELVTIDAMGQTTVPGVYAAGDMATLFQQVVEAAASGARAASGINHALVKEDLS